MQQQVNEEHAKKEERIIDLANNGESYYSHINLHCQMAIAALTIQTCGAWKCIYSSDDHWSYSEG